MSALSVAAVATALLISAGMPPAHAGVVSLDFEDAFGRVVYNNYFTQGFRFSPNSHYDIGGGSTGNWLGWDHGAPAIVHPYIESNPYWLGPAELSPWTNGNRDVGDSWMYIDASGAHFDLLSFDLVAYGLDVFSSNGGVKSVEINSTSPLPVSFSGDEWEGLTWLLVRAGSPGVPAGFDNLVMRVPEPGSLLLALTAVAFMSALGCRSAARPKLHV
jgi:hypothetical protein